jgi:PadR family transcriptional regulator, regulatory protein PadR
VYKKTIPARHRRSAAQAYEGVPSPHLAVDRYSERCILSQLSMKRQDSLQGAIDLMILKILSRRPKLHGYAIMMLIEEASEGVLRAEEGSLYPALRRMEEAGLLKAAWVLRDGRRARIYELTTQGRKQLETEESRWVAGTSAVNRVLKMA